MSGPDGQPEMTTPTRVRDHLEPLPPVVEGGSSISAVAARLGDRPGALLFDRLGRCWVVTARDVAHAVELGLGDRSVDVLARGPAPRLVGETARNRAVEALWRRFLPFGPVWSGRRITGLFSVQAANVVATAGVDIDTSRWLETAHAALRPRVEQCIETAHQLGAEVYVVGGAIRDWWLGIVTDDIDFIVEGDAIRVADALATRTGARVTAHLAFGTATVTWSDGESLDLAMARHERYTAPAALPLVTPSDALTDLERRDFPINAMMLAPRPDGSARLIDPFFGRFDLPPRGAIIAGRSGGRIRFFHPLSCVDDPTRIFRAARFGARFGLRLDPAARRTVALGASFTSRLSGERLRYELDLIWREPTAANACRRLGQWGIWSELGLMDATARRFAQRLGVIAELAASPIWSPILATPAQRSRVSLALLGWEMAADFADWFAERLDLTRPERHIVETATALASQIGDLNGPYVKPHAAYRLLHRLPDPTLAAARIVVGRRRAGERLDTFQQTWRHLPRLVDGVAVRRLSDRPPGPWIGEALEAVHAATLDGAVTTAAEAEQFLRSWLQRRPATT